MIVSTMLMVFSLQLTLLCASPPSSCLLIEKVAEDPGCLDIKNIPIISNQVDLHRLPSISSFSANSTAFVSPTAESVTLRSVLEGLSCFSENERLLTLLKIDLEQKIKQGDIETYSEGSGCADYPSIRVLVRGEMEFLFSSNKLASYRPRRKSADDLNRIDYKKAMTVTQEIISACEIPPEQFARSTFTYDDRDGFSYVLSHRASERLTLLTVGIAQDGTISGFTRDLIAMTMPVRIRLLQPDVNNIIKKYTNSLNIDVKKVNFHGISLNKGRYVVFPEDMPETRIIDCRSRYVWGVSCCVNEFDRDGLLKWFPLPFLGSYRETFLYFEIDVETGTIYMTLPRQTGDLAP